MQNTNYGLWSWLCLFIGFFVFGIVLYPMAFVLALIGSSHGERTTIQKVIAVIGTIVTVVFLFAFI